MFTTLSVIIMFNRNSLKVYILLQRQGRVWTEKCGRGNHLTDTRPMLTPGDLV